MRIGLILLVGAAVVGDSSIAAVIAGIAATANTVILLRMQRPVRATHAAIYSPRRIVYDAAGRPIGTVIDLRANGAFALDDPSEEPGSL